MKTLATTWVALATLTFSACDRPVQKDPDAEPPVGDPVSNVPVTPPDPDQVDPGGDPNNPPIVDEPLDPADCPLPNGLSVDCTTALNASNYCASVYPPNPAGQEDLPVQPNFELVSACGACDAQYFAPPADVVCDGAPVQQPPPDDFFDLEDSTCKTCHAPNNYDGLNSIENPHAWSTLDCTECHGGDGEATNQTFAHVCPPPEIGNRNQQVLDTRAFFLSFTWAGVQLLDDYYCTSKDGEQVLTSPLEWLAFQNPGDLRAGRAGMGCGTCHTDINDYISRSAMGNATGLNAGTRHGIGTRNKFADRDEGGPSVANDWLTQGDYGATAISNPDYDPNDRVVGEVPSLYQPEVFTGENFKFNNTYTADAVNNSLELQNLEAYNYPNGINNQTAEQIFQEVINQACTGCHLQNAYNNNRAGDYRSTGCTACHFEMGVSARSQSNDPNVDKLEPVNPNFLTPGEKTHISNHRIRNVAKTPGDQDGLFIVVQGIADQQCIVCHEGSNRTVAQYHGYRLDQNQDLTNNNFYPSNNTVVFTYRDQLFGENQFYNNRQLNQWIDTEIWQADVANVIGQTGQDETPADIHHEVGMGCVDCHGTGSTHGRGKIYSRMKVATHENDMLCETCHGTVDAYAENDGTYVLDQSGAPLKHIRVNDALGGDFWLVSKLNGSLHYVPQTKDVVNAIYQQGGGKVYPPGTDQSNQPIFNLVASYAMGRYQDQQNLADGYGPAQPTANGQIVVSNNFSHSDGQHLNQANPNTANQGLECYTCHSAWQNNCVGCHLDAFYDANPANFFYSQVTGERIYFNFNANFVYQNPINFMMGINDRGKISPYQGMHRFFSYTDLNNNTSNRISYADRNGLGNDPQLRNPNRNALPALQNQPYTPHSIRNRYTNSDIGGRGCLDCHLGNANQILMLDQNNNQWDLTNVYANEYANAAAVRIPESRGLGTALWLFDADGNPVVDTNNAAAYDLDRIVEANGVSNSSSNHPLLDPFGQYSNTDYLDWNDTNGAHMARPFTNLLLTRLQQIDNVGLTDVYYWNSQPNEDPNDTGVYTYFLNNYEYATQ